MLGGGIEIDTHLVDTTLNGLVKCMLQFRLVNVMLVLSYADALRVNLHQFRQWIHQSASYADSSAHGDILVGELISGCLGCRIDGGPVFADNEDRRSPFFEGGQILYKFAGFTGCCAVADGYCFNLIVTDHVEHVHLGFHEAVDRRVGEDGLVVKQVTLGVEAYHLATGAETWVYAHHALLSQWGIHQELAQILGKDVDGFIIRFFLAQVCKLRLYAGL